MDYTQKDEVHFVRCLKCLKILKCSRYDTSALLEHIRTDHPEIEIIESSAQPMTTANPLMDDTISSRGKSEQMSVLAEKYNSDNTEGGEGNLPEIQDCQQNNKKFDDAEILYKRRYNVRTPPTIIQTSRKRQRYRTSIEKWRPAKGTIYCPKCDAQKRPLIKERSERFAQNQCGAACILSCWPFCFLPFLCPGQNQEYLYCANCKHFLGLYDRDSNCVKPNREFVECVETTHETIPNGTE